MSGGSALTRMLGSCDDDAMTNQPIHTDPYGDDPFQEEDYDEGEQ